MKYLVLSTYPVKGSLNSGDDLLEKSLSKLISENDKDAEIIIANITIRNMILPNMNDIDVITGCFGVVYPTKWYRNNMHLILKKAMEYSIPCYAIALAGVWPGTRKQLEGICVDKELLQLLSELGDLITIVTRDFYSMKILLNNGINCIDCIGDIALYDSENIGKQYEIPKKVNKIAVSLPHNIFWHKQAIEIAAYIKSYFENEPEVYITLHGTTDVSKYDEVLEKHNIKVIRVYGGSEKLSFYREIDLHIGFRLHAHISMLRIRKPSILIAEDSRSLGHLYTFRGPGICGIPKWVRIMFDILSEDAMSKCMDLFNVHNFLAKRKVLRYINKEIQSGYPGTKRDLKLIDRYYRKKVNPFIDRIISKK